MNNQQPLKFTLVDTLCLKPLTRPFVTLESLVLLNLQNFSPALFKNVLQFAALLSNDYK